MWTVLPASPYFSSNQKIIWKGFQYYKNIRLGKSLFLGFKETEALFLQLLLLYSTFYNIW